MGSSCIGGGPDFLHLHAIREARMAPMVQARELDDGVVRLHAPSTRDVPEARDAVLASIPELVPWMPWCHEAYSEQDTREWIGHATRSWVDGSEYAFIVRDAASGRLLGSCGLNGLDRLNRWANLGYWLRTDATGHGYATRAARLVAAFGFDSLGLERIEILAAKGNVASQQVAERVGAVREGVLRRRIRVGDVQHDAVAFSLVREDQRV
jgi:RimJ/RimL family protein N-acetyltransferase